MSGPEEASDIELDPGRVAEWLDEQHAVLLVDVREGYERDAGHIEGSRHIELLELSAAAPSLQNDEAIVFYCRVGSRSLMAAQAFRASGFQAYSMRGGLERWAQEGRALTPEGGYVAEH